MSLSFGWEGRLTPKVRLGRGKNSGWCPIPFFDWVEGTWVTGPSLSLRFERLPEAYRPTEARKPHEWLRMDMARKSLRRLFLLGYWGTLGVLSRRVRVLAGNIHCVLFLGFAMVRREFHLRLLELRYCISLGRGGRSSRLS